jgi:hypothetical protein
MKKSTSLLINIFVIGFLYFFIQNGIDQLFSKLVFIFFVGVYFIVKQLEENNTNKKI